MSRNWPTLSSMRSSFHSAHTSGGAPISSWSASTKARSPTRMATPSPKRRDSPAQPCVGRGVPRRRRASSGPRRRRRRVVHHVVVEQGEGVHQLERRAGVDDPLVGRVAAGADEAPVAERRPQPLAARAHHAADLVERPARGRGRAPPSGRARPREQRRRGGRSTPGRRSSARLERRGPTVTARGGARAIEPRRSGRRGRR